MVSCRYLLWFQRYEFQWMGIDENFKSPYLGNYKEFRTFEGKRAVFIGVQEHDASIRFSLSLTVFEIWLFTLTPCKCNRVSRPILSVVDPNSERSNVMVMICRSLRRRRRRRQQPRRRRCLACSAEASQRERGKGRLTGSEVHKRRSCCCW